MRLKNTVKKSGWSSAQNISFTESHRFWQKTFSETDLILDESLTVNRKHNLILG